MNKLTDFVKMGWLHKKSPGVLTGWKRRYFVLTRGATLKLEYYELLTDSKPIDSIPLDGSIAKESVRSEKGKFIFEITPSIGTTRTYILSAESDSERKEWISLLNQEITAAKNLELSKSSRSEEDDNRNTLQIQCPLVDATSDTATLYAILKTMTELQESLKIEGKGAGLPESVWNTEKLGLSVAEQGHTGGQSVLTMMKLNLATVHLESEKLSKCVSWLPVLD